MQRVFFAKRSLPTEGSESMAGTIALFWWRGCRGRPNFGDEMGPYLFQRLTGRKAVFCDDLGFQGDVYAVAGSILHLCRPNHVVWGVGALSESRFHVIESRWGAVADHFRNDNLRKPKNGLRGDSRRLVGSLLRGFKFDRPRRIHAVRGPLTRRLLQRQGIDCPPVYGDPALLLPQVFRPEAKPQHSLGIFPHYLDAAHPRLADLSDRGALILSPWEPVETVIRKMLSCRGIASSSLHGVVTADAYGIPSLWIRFGRRLDAQKFKFHDYFLSIGQRPYTPVCVAHPMISPADIRAQLKYYRPRIDLSRLAAACPLPHTLADAGLKVGLEPHRTAEL